MSEGSDPVSREACATWDITIIQRSPSRPSPWNVSGIQRPTGTTEVCSASGTHNMLHTRRRRQPNQKTNGRPLFSQLLNRASFLKRNMLQQLRIGSTVRTVAVATSSCILKSSILWRMDSSLVHMYCSSRVLFAPLTLSSKPGRYCMKSPPHTHSGTFETLKTSMVHLFY